jgi:DNA modification methylase
LVKPCILAGSRSGDIVIDPFFGSGTTGLVAANYERPFIGIEIKTEYIEIAKKRLGERGLSFNVIDT